MMIILIKLVITAAGLYRRIKINQRQVRSCRCRTCYSYPFFLRHAVVLQSSCHLFSHMLPVLFVVEPEKIDGVLPSGRPTN